MSNIAYTIGRTSAYEAAIKEPGGAKKLGRREATQEEPAYDGGWVWRTREDADNFRINIMSIERPEWAAMDFSVYELELPTSWDVDVSSESIGKAKNLCGAHYLLNDSKIIGAVQRPWG